MYMYVYNSKHAHCVCECIASVYWRRQFGLMKSSRAGTSIKYIIIDRLGRRQGVYIGDGSQQSLAAKAFLFCPYFIVVFRGGPHDAVKVPVIIHNIYTSFMTKRITSARRRYGKYRAHVRIEGTGLNLTDRRKTVGRLPALSPQIVYPTICQLLRR